MKKLLAAALLIFAIMSMSFAVYAEEGTEEAVEEIVEEVEEIQQYIPYDPANDPTRINPSPLDEIIHRQAQQNYNRLNTGSETANDDDSHEAPSQKQTERRKLQRSQNSKTSNTRNSRNPLTQDNNNSVQFRNNNTRPSYSSNQSTSKNPKQAQAKKNSERRWQTWKDVKDKWHSTKAAQQFTNWTFTPDEVTVQLVDRNGKTLNTYTIYPLEDGNPDSGYELGEPVKAGTQIVVPDGCIVQGDFRHVNRNEDPAVFGTGEIMYFNSDDRGSGFIIFPYDHGRWRYQIGLR